MNASERKKRLERRVIHPAVYRVRHDNAELEGEENSGARWKRFPFLIMGLVFIAFGGWLFGRTIELSNGQIVGLVSALYFICAGQIYLAEFQKRSDDK